MRATGASRRAQRARRAREQGRARYRLLAPRGEADRRQRAHAERPPGAAELERDPAAQRVARHVEALVAHPGGEGRHELGQRPTVGGTDGPGSEAPNPGRSIAITSRRAARRSSTGSHMRQPAPRPWTSTSGAPSPAMIEAHGR